MTPDDSSYLRAKIRATSGGLSVSHSLLWPYDQKLLKRHGMEMEDIALESDTVGMQTLVSNESQFLVSSG